MAGSCKWVRPIRSSRPTPESRSAPSAGGASAGVSPSPGMPEFRILISRAPPPSGSRGLSSSTDLPVASMRTVAFKLEAEVVCAQETQAAGTLGCMRRRRTGTLHGRRPAGAAQQSPEGRGCNVRLAGVGATAALCNRVRTLLTRVSTTARTHAWSLSATHTSAPASMGAVARSQRE